MNAITTAVQARTATCRLLVTHRDPETLTYRALGFLADEAEQGYSFAYLRSAVEAPWFVALPGLSRMDRPSRSASLFPLFAERVISPRRPDRPQTMQALGLPLDAGPFDVLRRSAGRRVEDQIELVPVPDVGADGSTELDFLVHGVRYLSQEAQDRISALAVGEHLFLHREPTNTVNGRAVLVTESSELPVGYVPDPILDFVSEMTDVEASVLRANGPEVGFHMRLLVRLEGRLQSDPFARSEWATVSEYDFSGPRCGRSMD